MARFLLRLDDELYKAIVEKANGEGRSLNKHIEHIIRRDLETVSVPVEGTIKDGRVVLNKYWLTKEGMKEAAERG